jgi:hypothetical protein
MAAGTSETMAAGTSETMAAGTSETITKLAIESKRFLGWAIRAMLHLSSE